jgi:Luciferase-like monooxygenase
MGRCDEFQWYKRMHSAAKKGGEQNVAFYAVLVPAPWPVPNSRSMAQALEFGLDTFGDITVGRDGHSLSHAQVIRNVIEEAVLADELNVDCFGVGEHHRPDFAISSPEMVLAAIGGRTKRLILGSAVTVLSSDDPVRVFERFATLNAACNGRAEITVGRGSFTSPSHFSGMSFPNIRSCSRKSSTCL